MRAKVQRIRKKHLSAREGAFYFDQSDTFLDFRVDNCICTLAQWSHKPRGRRHPIQKRPEATYGVHHPQTVRGPEQACNGRLAGQIGWKLVTRKLAARQSATMRRETRTKTTTRNRSAPTRWKSKPESSSGPLTV